MFTNFSNSNADLLSQMQGLKIDTGILAGGKSTRMGFQNKALCHYQGEPFIERTCHLLAPFSYKQSPLINSNNEHALLSAFSPYVYADILGDYSGPLAGLHCLLSHTEADYILISPCDTPLLNNAYPERMLSRLACAIKKGHTAPILAASVNGHRQPLHCLLPKQALDALATSINQDKLKVARWFDDQPTYWVEFNDHADTFNNVNSPSDLKNLA